MQEYRQSYYISFHHVQNCWGVSKDIIIALNFQYEGTKVDIYCNLIVYYAPREYSVYQENVTPQTDKQNFI